MKQAFVIFVIFMMALGAGASYAYAAEGGEGGGESKDPNAPHPTFEYVRLDPITLPVITAKGLTQQVSLVVQLEVDWGKSEEIAPYEPRLTDA